MDELEAEASLLRKQVKLYREQDKNSKGKIVRQRLKKVEYNITTSFKDVARQQGSRGEEIEQMAASQPTTFTVMDNITIRERLKLTKPVPSASYSRAGLTSLGIPLRRDSWGNRSSKGCNST